MKAKYVNGTITIVLDSGEVLMRQDGTIDMFNSIDGMTDEQIKALMIPELETSVKRQVDISSDLDLLNNEDFSVVNGCAYLRGSKVSLPILLAEQLVTAIKGKDSDYYKALLNFWMLCLLNPNSQAREGLFEFLEKGQFTIMGNGMVLAYRNVVSKGVDDNSLVQFISNQYVKIKRAKKGPGNYTVYRNIDMPSELRLTKGIHPGSEEEYDQWELVGNLRDLYLDLPDMQENRYTDQYTGTMDIRIGRAVSMDRKLCTEDQTQSCSSGLHICSDIKDYASFGDTKLLVAFSPRNVVAVPETATTKMRVCEYFPLAVLEEGDEDFLGNGDTLYLIEEYGEEEVSAIGEMLTQSNAVELKQHYLIPDIQQTFLDNLYEKIQGSISNRVINI